MAKTNTALATNMQGVSAPQRVFVQQEQAPLFQDGSVQRQNLALGSILRNLWVNLQYTLASTSPTAFSGPADDLIVIQRVRLVANNKLVLVDLTIEQLRRINTFLQQTPPKVTAVAFGASMAFNTTFQIPLTDNNTIVPFDSSIDTRNFVNLYLEITWTSGAAAAVTNGTSATFTVTPNLQVFSTRSNGLGAVIFNTNLLYALLYPNLPVSSKITLSNFNIGNIYKGFILNTKTPNSTADLLNAITRVKIYSGAYVYFDMDATTFQTMMREIWVPDFVWVNGVERTFDRYTGANLNAWYWLNLIQDGLLTEAIDTNGLDRLYMDISVATNCDLTILPLETIPAARALTTAAA